MPLRVLCVLVAAAATADSWIWDGDDCPAATLVAPLTPEIVERTHRQQPDAAFVDRSEGESMAPLPSRARPIATPRPGQHGATRLPRRQLRFIARRHLRAPTEAPPHDAR